MSGRNRGPPHPMRGSPRSGIPPPAHEHQFSRGGGPMPHPALLEEMRDSEFRMGPRPMAPHPAIIEERLAIQNQDLQLLLEDNQRFAATHVALKQEVEAAQNNLQQMAHYADKLKGEKDVQMRELFDKSVKMEVDIRGAEAMKSELVQVRTDIKELTVARQELTGQVQMMTQDLARMTADLQQVPALKAEIDNMRQELQRARAAIEYEKKGYAENYEHGQMMEKNLVTMAREMEKLRAEIASAESRAPAPAAVNNPAAGYNPHYSNASYGNQQYGNPNYGNPEAGYAGNPYPAGYSTNPVQSGAEGYPQYGQAPAYWNAYGAQGNR